MISLDTIALVLVWISLMSILIASLPIKKGVNVVMFVFGIIDRLIAFAKVIKKILEGDTNEGDTNE